tara:strand:- start:965 stop:1669 length:705 start_codon:yes stop_codon:yes gene_type:complete
MKNSISVVVLTGAGISAESGIKTFRAADGLWENHSIEEVATPEGFNSSPKLVYEFYNQRRRQLISAEIQPNLAHIALAKFEHMHEGLFLLVTQNIDNLHERAGSKNIRHMHGELLKMRCIQTNQIFEMQYDFNAQTNCECCQQSGNLRPHVVWFGEMPLYMDEIHSALASCDLFIAIGTSGNVYPAAGFYHTAKSGGAQTVELNIEPTESAFDKSIRGEATEIVPRYFEGLLSK